MPDSGKIGTLPDEQPTSPLQHDTERLRRLWHEGKASGRLAPLDIERIIESARARLIPPAAE